MLRLSRFATLAILPLLTSPAAYAQTKAPVETPLDPDHAARMVKGLEIFKKHVKPILVSRCLRCHGGEHVKSQLDLSDRAELLKGGRTGPAVVPGKAGQSLILRLLRHEREPFMPKSGKQLPPEVIARFAAWIDLGAPYDAPLIARKKKGRSWTERLVSEEDRQLWSLQPLRHVQLPAVHDAAWCQTSLDRFILARQEQVGIKPNPEAERRTLIRRAYFDVLGLPPGPEEVEAFLSDPAADAYEKMIDRLLDSPHYGERWGRYWLDLARFAESHGFEHDYDRPSAYHYRDFVIRALNADMPYDAFVQWQLAGDELAPDNPLAQMATGFLAAGVHSTQITKNEVAKHRYDEMDDMLATTGTALLGMTIGCARCHDHKYDPIPQRDYYRLLSTFTTTVRSEVELDLNPEVYRKAKADFDRVHAPLEAVQKKLEAEALPARLQAWERDQKQTAKPGLAPWVLLEPASATSAGGATFTKLPDGSLLASGKNDKVDAYTLVVHTQMERIRAVRLEALAHPSLVKGGPGRAANGNFDLTHFRVMIAPKAGGDAVAVKLHSPRATFEQKGLPVAAAIDNDPKSGWAIDPQFGKDHAAVFETEKEIGFSGGSVLTFSLVFHGNDGHNIGRLRLSLTRAAAAPVVTGQGVPEAVVMALNTPPEHRDARQKAQLVHWYGTTIDPKGKALHRKIENDLRQAPRPTRT